MIKFFSILIILLVILFITSCVSSEKAKVRVSLEVVKSEINAWLNLMPGVSPGKFHLTGDVSLQNLSDEEIKSISLDNITVYSSEEVIYSFKPYFTPRKRGGNFILKTGMVKVFRFGMEEGLKIDERLGKNKFININFNFISDKGSYPYSIDSVKVQEAY
ncbi:MAG: hypothetical protein E2O46_06020 [Ignavibacteria bacterium]|jgi:hypothetical protein|nr:MAG: hypothetical protein E2O46_06020 [Ignavibacteria bacterium]